LVRGEAESGSQRSTNERLGFYERLVGASKALSDGIHAAGMAAGIPIQTGHCGGLWGFAFSKEVVRNFEDAKRADHTFYAKFFHAMLEQGVFLPPSGYEAMFVSAAHNDEVIAEVVSAAEEAFSSVTP